MGSSTDILIIGGGVVGVCTAYSFAERGARVVLVDRDEIASGASYGNAGWIAVGHNMPLPVPGAAFKSVNWLFNPESPLYIRPRPSPALARWLLGFLAASTERRMRRTFALHHELGVASKARFDTLAALPEVDGGLEHKGLLLLCDTHAGFEDAQQEGRLTQELGGEVETLSPQDVRDRWPIVARETVGAVHLKQVAHIDPAAFTVGVGRAAERAGARLLTNTEVITIEHVNGRVTTVVTTRGDFTCDTLVIAGGAWSPEIARPLGLSLPIQPAKGYCLICDRPAEFGDTPISLFEGKVAMTPLGDTLRVGGTLELAGADMRINQRRVEALVKGVRRFLPGLAELRRREVWRGLRPLTYDDLPIIGRTERFSNLVLATGHGMRGLTQGPATGELVAQLLSAETPALDLAPFSPDRFRFA